MKYYRIRNTVRNDNKKNAGRKTASTFTAKLILKEETGNDEKDVDWGDYFNIDGFMYG